MKPVLAWLAIITGLIGYQVASGWWFPLTSCWCCKGSGRHSRKDGKVFRDCRVCRGRGRRFRIGRKIWNYFRGLRARA